MYNNPYNAFDTQSIAETWIPRIMIGMFCAFIVFMGLTIFSNCSGSNKETAEQQAMQYAKDFSLEVKKVQCVNYDSDHDGYVSCTIAYINDGRVELMPVECASSITFNSGCRAPKTVINGYRSRNR